MRLAISLTSLAFVALLATPAVGQVDTSNVLDDYMKRPQPAYGWEVTKTENMPNGLVLHRIKVTSQVWQGIKWTHRLNLVIPPAAQGERARPGHALLGIAGGGEAQALMFVGALAIRLGVPVAILHDIPNQPLFKGASEKERGLKEDALIAHTFKNYMETGDTSWPLLLPMTRSVLAAMDCMEDYSAQQAAKGDGWAFGTLSKFVTSGGSKRGWTTWLSAIADKRVIGIAPIVYDNLNLPAQMALHYETWGKPSLSIHDYTDRGLTDKTLLHTARGKELVRIVDPYSYANRLDVPKLALIGTNDTYWPLEAVHLYRGGLPGELHLHYVPNAGHGVGPSVIQAIAGFFDHVTNRIADVPVVDMAINPRTSASLDARNPADRKLIREVRLWGAHADGKGFTKAKWVRVAAEPTTGGWLAPLPEPCLQSNGRAAFIGEIEIADSSGAGFLIHTPVQVWELNPLQQK